MSFQSRSILSTLSLLIPFHAPSITTTHAERNRSTWIYNGRKTRADESLWRRNFYETTVGFPAQDETDRVVMNVEGSNYIEYAAGMSSTYDKLVTENKLNQENMCFPAFLPIPEEWNTKWNHSGEKIRTKYLRQDLSYLRCCHGVDLKEIDLIAALPRDQLPNPDDVNRKSNIPYLSADSFHESIMKMDHNNGKMRLFFEMIRTFEESNNTGDRNCWVEDKSKNPFENSSKYLVNFANCCEKVEEKIGEITRVQLAYYSPFMQMTMHYPACSFNKYIGHLKADLSTFWSGDRSGRLATRILRYFKESEIYASYFDFEDTTEKSFGASYGYGSETFLLSSSHDQYFKKLRRSCPIAALALKLLLLEDVLAVHHADEFLMAHYIDFVATQQEITRC